MKTCVVNFATRNSWHEKCQQRMVKSFMANGFDGDYLLYSNESELNCPKHKEVPYAFKPYVFKKAQKQGYDIVLWVDSSISLIKPAQIFINQILKDGYLLLLNGWTTGQWCSDAALKTLGITREESFEIPHLMACVMGLNLRSKKSCEFLNQYYARSEDGTYKGAWTNKNREVSTDGRVLGHRHDQTAASVIAWKLDMRNWLADWLVYDEGNNVQIKDTTVFTLRHGL